MVPEFEQAWLCCKLTEACTHITGHQHAALTGEAGEATLFSFLLLAASCQLAASAHWRTWHVRHGGLLLVSCRDPVEAVAAAERRQQQQEQAAQCAAAAAAAAAAAVAAQSQGSRGKRGRSGTDGAVSRSRGKRKSATADAAAEVVVAGDAEPDMPKAALMQPVLEDQVTNILPGARLCTAVPICQGNLAWQSCTHGHGHIITRDKSHSHWYCHMFCHQLILLTCLPATLAAALLQ